MVTFTPDVNGREVTISLDEYGQLKTIDAYYRLLLNYILDDAKLSYNKKFMTYNDETISQFLKIVAPDDYEGTFEALIEKENNHE